MKFFAVSLFFILFSVHGIASAQIADYQRATQFMQEHRYEEALPILEKLYHENRRSLVLFDSYINCLVSLRKYDRAEVLVSEQIEQGPFAVQATLKLAEILHISGKPDEALTVWYDLAEQNPLNIQLIFTIANSLINRQEFEAAIDLYKSAREKMRDPTIFLNELGNVYMLAGRFEESVNEYYSLIIDSPDQISLVQQRFFRMRDQQLYEIAAFELEDRLIDMHYTHPAYSSMAQLLTWLLLETEQYRRAFLFSRNYETQTPFTIYSLFSLATQLRSAGQFELAADAMEFYLNDGNEAIRNRAREDLSTIYIDWAEYLRRHNLGTNEQLNTLNRKAADLKIQLLESSPGYGRADRVLGTLVDLLTDEQKNSVHAQKWVDRMRHYPVVSESEWLPYSEGKIALFNGEFSSARQFFTRASRISQNQTFEERTRYLLSLADFYAGDYDFSLIQLRSIERRSTSFYANDAIELGLWIQNGLRADTTRALMDTISESFFLIHTGNYHQAVEKLAPIYSQIRTPLVQSVLIRLNSELPDEWVPFRLLLTDYALSAQMQSPHRERLLWDRVRLLQASVSFPMSEFASVVPDSYSFLLNENRSSFLQKKPSDEDYISALEDLLMEFPDGFYAPFVRERLAQPVTLSPEL